MFERKAAIKSLSFCSITSGILQIGNCGFNSNTAGGDATDNLTDDIQG